MNANIDTTVIPEVQRAGIYLYTIHIHIIQYVHGPMAHVGHPESSFYFGSYGKKNKLKLFNFLSYSVYLLPKFSRLSDSTLQN